MPKRDVRLFNCSVKIWKTVRELKCLVETFHARKKPLKGSQEVCHLGGKMPIKIMSVTNRKLFFLSCQTQAKVAYLSPQGTSGPAFPL